MACSTISKATRCWLRLPCLLTLASFAAQAGAATLDGFITKIASPTDFYISSQHVLINEKTQCFTETFNSNIKLVEKTHIGVVARHSFGSQSSPDPKSRRPLSCESLPLAIGSHLQIRGDVMPGKDYFSSTQVTVYEVGIRQTFSTWPRQSGWESAALLEEPPQLSHTAKGWTGTMWLDGYPMQITPATTLLTAPSNTQISYRQFGPFLVNFSTPRLGAVLPRSPSPPFSATLFEPNTWAAYQSGVGQEHDAAYQLDLLNPLAFIHSGEKAPHISGQIMLDQLRLWPNQVDKAEKKYWAHFTPAIHVPDYQKHASGSVKFPHARADKILPDQAIQNYVSRLGTTLIPQYQRTLPETDETKIHFRFYVFQPVGKTFSHDFAVASPDGLILIPEDTLARMKNEAQLASLLSYAITSVLQKHTYIEQYARPDFSFNPDVVDTARFVFTLSMSEQALRIGIREMYLAGYDIREAPLAWAAAAGKPVVNPVMDPKYPNEDVPWETAYAFDYISRYYSDVDYGKLKTGEAEYQQFLGELRKADPEAFEKK